MSPQPPPYAIDRASLERDCQVEFFTASGPGGQHRNRSRTGVRLRHGPSGRRVTATERRSQSMNLEIAYERMAVKLAALNHKPKKRRPTRPTRSSQRVRVQDKRQRSETKQRRKPPASQD